jgi:hypothetical protein
MMIRIYGMKIQIYPINSGFTTDPEIYILHLNPVNP